MKKPKNIISLLVIMISILITISTIYFSNNNIETTEEDYIKIFQKIIKKHDSYCKGHMFKISTVKNGQIKAECQKCFAIILSGIDEKSKSALCAVIAGPEYTQKKTPINHDYY
jgi:hypothetical protein